MGQIYDVIVAGGGPAGSTAARTAALRGLDVLILEKSIFPRYKPCGGALSLKALSMLDGPLPTRIQERKITGARVHYRDLVLERHKGYEITQLIDRSAFDQYLLERAILAGARAMTEKALGFLDSGEWISVQTKDGVYKSRFLVVASGCQDALKKEIAGPESKKSMGLCLVTEIEAEEDRIVEHLGSALDIHFSVAGGYGWIFPHRGYYSVGIGGLSSTLCHPRQTMRRFLRENGFSQEARLAGHLIPQGGNRRRVAQGRVLLAGDAAGLVDPFTGEGTYYALASGKIAGEMVGDVQAKIVASSYESRIEKELGRELGHALFFSKIMHRHPRLFLRILAREEQVLERYLEVGAGRMSYRDFMIWLLPRLPLSLMRAGLV